MAPGPKFRRRMPAFQQARLQFRFPVTMAAYAADAAALLNHVGWPSARVFGISFGAWWPRSSPSPGPSAWSGWRCCAPPREAPAGAATRCTSLTACRPTNGRRSRWNLDTRFSPDWLSSHPSDLALVEQAAEREASPMTAEQREGARLQLEARSSHDVWSRLGQDPLSHTGRLRSLRRPRTGRQLGGHGLADHRQHAAPLRGRPPVRAAGSAGTRRDPLLPLGVAGHQEPRGFRRQAEAEASKPATAHSSLPRDA